MKQFRRQLFLHSPQSSLIMEISCAGGLDRVPILALGFQKNRKGCLYMKCFGERFAFVLFLSLLGLAASPKSAQAQVDGPTLIKLTCENSYKAARGSGIKKRDLPKTSSCLFVFDISVKSHPASGEERTYLGTSLFALTSSHGAAKFSGTPAQIFAGGESYFIDPDTQEPITPENAELLTFQFSPSAVNIPGGSSTNSGITCSETKIRVDRTFAVPYLPNEDGLISSGLTLELHEETENVCRRHP